MIDVEVVKIKMGRWNKVECTRKQWRQGLSIVGNIDLNFWTVLKRIQYVLIHAFANPRMGSKNIFCSVRTDNIWMLGSAYFSIKRRLFKQIYQFAFVFTFYFQIDVLPLAQMGIFYFALFGNTNNLGQFAKGQNTASHIYFY